MIDHFGINCANLDESKRFYDAVLATLGGEQLLDYGIAVGYGNDGHPDFWISTMQDGQTGPNREMHVAFRAPDVATVQAFYETAIA